MTPLKALKKLTCAFSLLLATGVVLASDLSDFRDAVAEAESKEAFDQVMANAPAGVLTDPNTSYFFEDEGVYDWKYVQTDLLQLLDGKLAFEEQAARGKLSDPKETATEILSGPLYIDRHEREGRNWLERAGSRLGDRLFDLLSRFFPERGPQFSGFGLGSFGSAVVTVAWFLIGAAILLVVYFVLINVKGVKRRRKRVGGILEDDEPERTADQWLEHAERLEGEGRFREAVRCLYLACLVRYDDGRVARFRRHETNWEHLYRIEGSPINPKEIDFRDVTQKFDKVWYGNMVRGAVDVAEFKEVYNRLCNALQIKRAA